MCCLAGVSTETGAKRVQVHLIDADGKDIVPPLQGQFEPPREQPGGRWETCIIMQYGNVKFPRYGVYSISFVVDDHEMASIPFSVVQPPTSR